MRKLSFYLENLFTVVSIFYFSQGLFSLFSAQTVDGESGSSGRILGNIGLLIYTITSILLIVRLKETYKVVRRKYWLFFLLILAITSLLWSSVPVIASKKVISMIGTTLFGIYLGSHYTFNRQLKLMGWSFGISILLSFVFVFLLPAYGIMHTDAIEGDWQGIYPHKSTLGERMVLSFLTFYFLSGLNPKHRILCNIACLLSIVLIIFSKSATSIISLLSLYIILNTIKYLSLKSKLGMVIIFLSLAGFFLVQFFLILNLPGFLNASSKDITLTGRTPLWESLWDFIKLKIWFGYGYGSFFSAAHTETQQLWKTHSWGALHAHNGYIQILVDLGFVGFIVFIWGYFTDIIKPLLYYLLSRDMRMLWIFSFLLYTVIFNFTESSFLSSLNLSWVISVAFIHSIPTIRAAKF
jgi:exopolysaccharide production protein ExoQ